MPSERINGTMVFNFDTLPEADVLTIVQNQVERYKQVREETRRVLGHAARLGYVPAEMQEQVFGEDAGELLGGGDE